MLFKFGTFRFCAEWVFIIFAVLTFLFISVIINFLIFLNNRFEFGHVLIFWRFYFKFITNFLNGIISSIIHSWFYAISKFFLSPINFLIYFIQHFFNINFWIFDFDFINDLNFEVRLLNNALWYIWSVLSDEKLSINIISILINCIQLGLNHLLNLFLSATCHKINIKYYNCIILQRDTNLCLDSNSIYSKLVSLKDKLFNIAVSIN